MNFYQRKIIKPLALSIFMVAQVGFAQSFKVEDIRIEGLQRVSAGTVFNYLPIKAGQQFDLKDSPKALSTLYEQKLFSQVNLARQGNTLVVQVQEFPVINEIQLKGNGSLAASTIKEAFAKSGFREGQPFNPAMLQEMTAQLYAQYHAMSKFQVEIDAQTKALPRGRTDIVFNIKEGKTSKIKSIDFVGNQIYPDSRLIKLFDTQPSKALSFFSKSDLLNPERMQADYERLESFYQDRGFVDFKINSVQNTLSDDKTQAFITVNLTEGKPYTFTGFNIGGNTIISKEELGSFVKLKKGEIYNRSLVRQAMNKMKTRLADEGYAKADVEIIPDIDRLTQQISLTFVVNPGERITVRKIEFTGNKKSYDTVLRRELRQQEMAPYSASDIQRSEERIQRLPQVESLEKTMVDVEGYPDQVDVVYKVKERSTSYIQGGIGYGDSSGALFTVEYTDDNFVGTGNRLGVNFGKSSSTESYGLSFTNPYFTDSGVSAQLAFNYDKYDYDKEDFSDWTADNASITTTFGYPLSEYQRIFFGGGVRKVKISTGYNVAQEIDDYITRNGNKFNEIVLNTSFVRDTTNSAYMPSTGAKNSISLEVVPATDQKYYRLDYSNRTYFSSGNPDSLVIGLKGDVSYGDSLDNNEQNLPFYRKYYAGGINTIRGYEYGSVGPRYSNGDKAGGDFRINGGVELMLPISFNKRTSNFRLGTFVDGGGVWTDIDKFDSKDIRYSTGVFMNWLSPVGPLNFSYGVPLNAKKGDDKENFQFTIGTSF